MIAMPIGEDLRWIMVASPTYLDQHPAPEHPDDLALHRCIGIWARVAFIIGNWKGEETVRLAADWSVRE
jgi:DNA-binding transcriptional LysR family regulator